MEEATSRIERMNDELILARREAETARASKARFAATASHEIRGPLNLILGFSKMMALSPERYGAPLPRAYHADIDAIYRNSQHLAALVDDILDLSQVEANKLPLVKDRVDLKEDVIKKAGDIVQPLAERKGLYLRQEVAEDLPWILADAVRLRQVLLNLLTNAIRFTEQGGITVCADRQDDVLLVSVQDTGLGIPAEEMPKLFQEFSQTHLPESSEAPSSGLGLSISKHLVELHGGKIWVDSNVNKGTSFYFTVPLPGFASRRASSMTTSSVRHHTVAHKTCLIVHDDPGIARLLARYLENHRIVAIPDASEVLTLIEELHPQAILADRKVAEDISDKLAGTPFDVPIITCELPHVTHQDQLKGVISYLIKPIVPEILTAAIKEVDSGDGITVLLVDDDPDAVRLMEMMLTLIPRPYKILRAYDGRQALELMQAVVPDIVFLDLLMPGMDGRQTIVHMQADERLRQVPVVVVTAQDWFEEGFTLGMPISLHAKKPVEVVRGVRCLQALLDVVKPRYLPEPVLSEPS